MKEAHTLEDVARKAHVSKMTVSRVINHPDLVTDELKSIVLDAMDKLDYHPNNVARALASNRTNVIKLVILEDIDKTEPYYGNLMIGIAKALKPAHYTLQLVIDRERIDQGACDGMIITGARVSDYQIFKNLKEPFILFGENRGGFDFVDTNNLLGDTMATEYALSRGYSNVIFIGIDINEAFEFSREAGYVNTMQKNKKIPSVFKITNSSVAGRQFMEENINIFKKNTCFICSSDQIALGVLQALIHSELNVPNDYGVIGFDGFFLNKIASPNLTTVKQSLMGLGEKLSKMILQKINQNGAPQGEQFLDPELLKGGSTK